MSEPGAYEDEMGHFSRLSDQELDRLLAGKEPSEEGRLEDLAAFLAEAAVVLPEAPEEATAARHLAAIVAATQLQAEDESPASRPSVSPSGLDRKALFFRSRSKLMRGNPFSSLAGKIALAAIVVLAAFGGTAYAGGLPDPVQGAVADVADTIGVSLPGADNDSDDGAVNDIDDGAVNDSDDGAVGNGDDGAVSDTNDGTLGNIDQSDENNVDDGKVDNADEGNQGDVQEGDQDNSDGGDQGNDGGGESDSQGNGDQGASQSGGDQGGGDQGDGNN